MTDDEMRIAIAEECRWRIEGSSQLDHSIYDHELFPFVLRSPDGKSPTNIIYKTKEAAWGAAPDYLNDLNAIQAAVMTLPEHGENSRDSFLRELQIVTAANDNWLDACVNATARQRAEAFLRAVGKWRDA